MKQSFFSTIRFYILSFSALWQPWKTNNALIQWLPMESSMGYIWDGAACLVHTSYLSLWCSYTEHILQCCFFIWRNLKLFSTYLTKNIGLLLQWVYCWGEWELQEILYWHIATTSVGRACECFLLYILNPTFLGTLLSETTIICPKACVMYFFNLLRG